MIVRTLLRQLRRSSSPLRGAATGTVTQEGSACVRVIIAPTRGSNFLKLISELLGRGVIIAPTRGSN